MGKLKRAEVGAVPKRKPRLAMPIILRNVPPGYDWGWYSREDPRMHLQTLDDEHRGMYKVWLERKGKRVFEPTGKIPSKVQKAIEAEVSRFRRHIDGRWGTFMIRKNWIQLHVSLPEVVITAYPGTPNKFSRKVNLQEWFSPETYAEIRHEDVFLNRELGTLSVFKDRPEDLRDDFDLALILWQG